MEEQVWRTEPHRGPAPAGDGAGEHGVEEVAGRPDAQEQGAGDCSGKKRLSPERQRMINTKVQAALLCSERAVCRWLSLSRSTFSYRPKPTPEGRQKLEMEIVRVSKVHPTLGYNVNKKQVQRIRRKEGLQVPPPKRRQRRRDVSTGLP